LASSISSALTAACGSPSRAAVMAMAGKSQPQALAQFQPLSTECRVDRMTSGSISAVGGTNPHAYNIDGWSRRRVPGRVPAAA
jgi:hypothetical protein